MNRVPPGKAFKLAEGEFLAALEPVVAETDALGLATATGAVSFRGSGEPSGIANEALDRYYASSISGVRADRNGERRAAAVSAGASLP